jgi:hypothetical protein
VFLVLQEGHKNETNKDASGAAVRGDGARKECGEHELQQM